MIEVSFWINYQVCLDGIRVVIDETGEGAFHFQDAKNEIA